MQKEALEYMKKCDLCQKFAPNIHQGFLNPLSSPSPSAQWGLDIVGPFPKAAGNKKLVYDSVFNSVLPFLVNFSILSPNYVISAN